MVAAHSTLHVAVFAAGHFAQANRARTAIESWLGASESD
jgi:hypothetical protein